MKKLEITKGDWEIQINEFNDNLIVCNCNYLGEILGNDNAILVADAGTTYNKLQILPSQLAEDRERLIDMLTKAINEPFFDYSKAQELLKSLNQ